MLRCRRRAGRCLVAIWLGALLLAISGFMAAAADIPQPRALGRDFPVWRAPQEVGAAASAPAVVTLPDPLTLRAALAASLTGSPALAAFSWEVRSREARILQAGLFPNPAIDVSVEDFGGSGARRSFEAAETTVSLAQLVELGGKRGRRRRLARLERDLAAWDFETHRLDVFADVTKAFVTVLALEERQALATELVRVATTSVETVAATVRAGAVSPIEEQRARVAAAQAEVDRVQIERELNAARASLAAVMGLPIPTFGALRGDLASVADPPPVDHLLAAVEETPELARWAAEIEQREAALALEQSERIPDVTIGPGIRRYADDGTTALVFGVSVPLPLFNRNQGAVLEARYRLAQADTQRRAAEVGIRGLLRSAHERLVAAFRQVTMLRDSIIPQARSVYDGALEGYRKGLFRYLEVLDAQRTLFGVRSQYVEALATYHRTVADVERLIAAPLRSAAGAEEESQR